MSKRGYGGRRLWFALATVALVVGCAHQRTPPAPEPPAQPAPAPAPPRETINSGLGPEESLWHVRAGLNVAALLCTRQPGGAAIVQRYNALLTGRKAALATAYASETQHYGAESPAALDRHMTQLYNFFARPEGTVAFCAAAVDVAQQAVATPETGLADFAPLALARLETALLAPPVPVSRIAPAQTDESAAPAGDWRIQLGAFTGRAAAETAWSRIRTRLPALSAYMPHYEDVPNSRLVRVQIGPAADRAGALRLCATAAAGGFDCMPVAKWR